jgi:prephenate dehydrogenase
MWDTVAIIGVGLIGGSIGLALQRRGLVREVVGIGRRETTLRAAQHLGAVTARTTDVAQGVARADVVVVCTPVELIVDYAIQASRACPAGTLITDAGSVKGGVCRTAAARWEGRGFFVGAHPLAGSEKTGAAFALADLFDDRLTVITPLATTAEQNVRRAEAFWRSLGSRVLRTTPEAHDAAVADTSHLPHLVASALASTTSAEHLPFVAAGWCDTTRVASGDVELWRQILMENRAHVLRALDDFEKVLTAFRETLAAGDRQALLRLLEAGKQRRDSVGS